MQAVALCALGQPDNAEQRLLAALPLMVPGDGTQHRTICDLLSDPPLLGIDQRRTSWAVSPKQEAPLRPCPDVAHVGVSEARGPSDPWSLAPGRLCQVFTRLCRAARG